MTLSAVRYARVLPADELRDGELIPVEIDGTPVVLVRHEGAFYAVQNNCSHRDFPLSEAGFDPRDGVLVCAWHGGCFASGSWPTLDLYPRARVSNLISWCWPDSSHPPNSACMSSL